MSLIDPSGEVQAQLTDLSRTLIARATLGEVVFKVVGVLALVIPQVPKRVKEWAYSGFAFDFIFATISHGAVDGINGQTFFPLVVLGILAISYIYYHKLNTNKN